MESWRETIHKIAEIVGTSSAQKYQKDQFLIQSLAVHICIALLLEGKISDASYMDYAFIIDKYIDNLGNYSPVFNI
jgi:hypothetical protein